MNWDDILAFRAVAEQRSFTRAAIQLRVTRQALAKRVARLERSVRASLLTRTTRRVELTEAGERLLEAAGDIAKVWSSAVADIATDNNRVAGLPDPIRLASFSLAIPMLLEAMSTTIPEANWVTRPFDAERSVRELRDGTLDLVFGFTEPAAPLPDFKGLERQLILTEPLWLAVSENHPLASAEDVDLPSLAQEAWVSRPSGTFKDLLVDICLKAGFDPKITHVAEDNHAVRALVTAGLAVTLCAPGVPVTDGLATTPIRNPPQRICYAAWRADVLREPFVTMVVDGLHEWYFRTAQQNPRYWRYLGSHADIFTQVRGRELLRAAQMDRAGDGGDLAVQVTTSAPPNHSPRAGA